MSLTGFEADRTLAVRRGLFGSVVRDSFVSEPSDVEVLIECVAGKGHFTSSVLNGLIDGPEPRCAVFVEPAKSDRRKLAGIVAGGRIRLRAATFRVRPVALRMPALACPEGHRTDIGK